VTARTRASQVASSTKTSSPRPSPR
jgi:hypothetical protein